MQNAHQSFTKKTTHPLIVHSHLRWDFVWQRPQQFLSRLSDKRRILFCEGPSLFEDDGVEPFYVLREAAGFPNITIMQTNLPASRFGDGKWVDAQRLRLLKEALDGPLYAKFNKPIQWFYDPMAITAFLDELNEVAVVYDCMDELSQFKFAPPELIERERLLLAAADLVFAGGRKMWQSKKRFNDNCHFYGCGVDVAHFSTALNDETPLPADLAAIPSPRLGYFGVIDERMDYDLIAKLADANPQAHVVMIGPTAKVDISDLPQRANLHWLGGRDYSELPSYVKGLDVCLMPFALNEATEYINPTKALEYMATGTPIVSTPVPDVVSNFSTALQLAYTHDEFINCCQAAITSPCPLVIKRGLEMANSNTWEAIVEKLEGHLEDAILKQQEEVEPSRVPEKLQSLLNQQAGRVLSGSTSEVAVAT